MRPRHVAHIDPGVELRLRNLLLRAVDQPVDVGAGGVELVEAGHDVDGRPVDHGRADGGDGEVGALGGDEVEGCFLREGLAGAVGGRAVGGLGGRVCYRVPVRFGVGVLGPGAFFHVEDGGEGGGDDDALDARVVGVDGFEDLGRAVDGGV